MKRNNCTWAMLVTGMRISEFRLRETFDPYSVEEIRRAILGTR